MSRSSIRPLSVIVAPLVALVAIACAPAPEQQDAGSDGDGVIRFDAGPPPVPVVVDAGPDAGLVDAGPVNSVTIVDTVTPSTGALVGGYRVRIDGSGFTPDSAVFFGDVEADQVLYLSNRTVSCRVPTGVAPGPVDVRVVSQIGIGEVVGGFTYFSPVTVQDISPTSGPSSGGTAVTIHGVGLHDGMIVLVGGRQAVDVVVDSGGTRATLRTPPGVSGRVDVEGLDEFGRSVLSLAFRYVDDVAVTAVVPSVVDAPVDPAQQGAIVELQGAGFVDDDVALVQADIGGASAARANLINGERLRVVVPAGVSGTVDVGVVRGSSSATLAGGLVVLPPPTGAFALTAAQPTRLDVVGGETLALLGEGFAATPVTGVSVGGVEATALAVSGDRRLQVTAPACAAGPIDVVVTRADASTATLTIACLARLVVSGISPGAVASSDPGAITISGRGFVDGAQVLVGGAPATDVVVTATSITATAPAGSAGNADVVVVLPDGQRATLHDALLYEAPLSVLGVRPARGGMSGNTFVTVTGTGFSRLSRLVSGPSGSGVVGVLFGGTPARPDEVTIVSDNLLTVRTPPGAPANVDVSVVLASSDLATITEQASAPRAFTYFDPTSFIGGTAGGPIDGAVYFTALDAVTGFPVPNLLAYTGLDGHPTSAGITNELGQATLSGPDIVGPQTVSVAGTNYEYSTVVDVDASQITLYLMPLAGGPPSSGGGPPPPPPATMRGRVFGFAKEFFDPAALGPDEIALAVVATTARDEFSGTPDPGGDNVVFEEGGEFFIGNSRPGRLGLIALAGIFNLTTQEFRPRQMGVRREVFPQFGVELTDQDIELTIPLDRDVAVSLPDAPLTEAVNLDDTGFVGQRPTITRVVPFIRLGGEGSFAYTSAIDADRNHALENMPDVPGEMLTFIAGAYTTTGRNLLTREGTADVTTTSNAVTGHGTQWDITDFFGTPQVIGKIFVVEYADGTRWGSDITGMQNATTIRLRDRPPTSGNGLRYHIGDAGFPSSEVVQDGTGDLRGGVTIQPVLGLPEILTPLENGVLEGRTLQWKPAPGQQPTIHQMYVYEPFDFSQLWSFYVDGARTKVPVPHVPELADFLRVLPRSQRALPDDFVPPVDLLVGGFAWQHEAIFVPGLDFNQWSLLDIGSRGRRAWTTDLRLFVHGSD